MKIFITGITGFVGSSVASYFATLGHTVEGIGRKKALPAHVPDSCKYMQVDISKQIQPIDADIVIHAAALASDTCTYEQAYTANVVGTQNVLNAAKNVSHFIHISSSSVYHFNKESMLEMDAGKDLQRLSAYGKSKWLSEEKVRLHSGIIKKTILRPRAIYGKYDVVLLPRLLKLVKGNRFIMPAHLSKFISLTHIQNLVQAIDLCISGQQENFAVYNVADAAPYNLQKVLATLLSGVTAKQLQPFIIPASLFNLFIAANDRFKFSKAFNRFAADSLTSEAVMNIDAISQELGYLPKRNFFNSYNEIVDWVQAEKGYKILFEHVS